MNQTRNRGRAICSKQSTPDGLYYFYFENNATSVFPAGRDVGMYARQDCVCMAI